MKTEKNEKNEIEILNEKVSMAITDSNKKSEQTKEIVNALKTNQNSFYNWDKIERGLDSYIRDDNALLAYIKQSFGDNMLIALVRKYVPEIKNDLNKFIDEQIESLKK